LKEPLRDLPVRRTIGGEGGNQERRELKHRQKKKGKKKGGVAKSVLE